MIIVTGAAGFIGSNLVQGLNLRGLSDVLVVDDLKDGDKFRNLSDLAIADYLDRDEFLDRVVADDDFGPGTTVFHLGACSDTMESDGRYMMGNNFGYSKALLHWCLRRGYRLIYASSASVYGSGPQYREDPEVENALNVYAYSKLQFDRYVRRVAVHPASQIVGLRYFNIYGPRERHKGRMASVAFHFFNQLRAEGHVRLFEGSGGFGNGEQRRDFVWVRDTVDVKLFFLDHRDISGIFNVGTGRSQSFNDVAAAVVNTSRGEQRAAAEWAREGVLRYIPFPPALAGKYQSFTQADISRLRAVGYEKPFATVEEGVARYVAELRSGEGNNASAGG
jgi:ADP-L-glycero-D-manno-heptose 6-epimerase